MVLNRDAGKDAAFRQRFLLMTLSLVAAVFILLTHQNTWKKNNIMASSAKLLRKK